MSTIPPGFKLPEGPISGPGGRLTEEWNLWFVTFLRYLTGATNLAAEALLNSGSGSGGVATAGAGPAIDLTYEISDEGISNLGARADHTHRRSVGVESAGEDFGEGAIINTVAPFLDSELEPDIDPTAISSLYAHWPLREITGTRYMLKGFGATSGDAIEVGGTVPSTPRGKFGRAKTLTLNRSEATLVPTLDWTAGFHMSIWISSNNRIPTNKQRIYIATESTKKAYGFEFARYLITDSMDPDYGKDILYWHANDSVNDQGGPDSAYYLTDPLDLKDGRWHLVQLWYNPSNGRIGTQFDDEAAIETESLGTFALGDIELMIFGGGYFVHEWDGHICAASLFAGNLTAGQRDSLYTMRGYRCSIGLNPFALETFGG